MFPSSTGMRSPPSSRHDREVREELVLHLQLLEEGIPGARRRVIRPVVRRAGAHLHRLVISLATPSPQNQLRRAEDQARAPERPQVPRLRRDYGQARDDRARQRAEHFVSLFDLRRDLA